MAQRQKLIADEAEHQSENDQPRKSSSCPLDRERKPRRHEAEPGKALEPEGAAVLLFLIGVYEHRAKDRAQDRKDDRKTCHVALLSQHISVFSALIIPKGVPFVNQML